MSTRPRTMTRAEVLAKLEREKNDALFNEQHCPVPQMAEQAKGERHAYEIAISLVNCMGASP